MKELISSLRLAEVNLPKNIKISGPMGLDLFLSDSNETSATERRHLYSLTKTAFDQLDHTQSLTPEIAGDLYQTFTSFLNTDINNGRILLYLPQELLPYLDQTAGKPAFLLQAEKNFSDHYKKSWLRLLFESNVRASFVDGDVLEPGLGEPSRVRKAAHLLPDMITHGIISVAEVENLLKITDDDELINSLTEGLTAAKDTTPLTTEVDSSEFQLDTDLKKIDLQYATGSPYIASWSPARVAWEKQVKRQDALDRAAKVISRHFLSHQSTPETIERLFQTRGFDQAYPLTALKSIIISAETLSHTDFPAAKKIADTYIPLLHNYWFTSGLEIKNTIASGLNHWARLKLVDDSLLHQLGVPFPDLTSPFPVDLSELINGDFKPLATVAQHLNEDPELSKDFFPLILAYGSRVKGVGSLVADTDIAVFIKPSVPFEKRERVLAELRQKNPELNGIDKILEYWIDQKDGHFGLRSVSPGTITVAGAMTVHFLMDGLWIGASGGYEKLYHDIGEKYLDLSRFGDQKEEARTQLLSKLELDMLQFRLMHKGYRYYYPSAHPTGTAHTDLIDGTSDFWDPGYRRVATLLFLSRVFLPDLSS